MQEGMKSHLIETHFLQKLTPDFIASPKTESILSEHEECRILIPDKFMTVTLRYFVIMRFFEIILSAFAGLGVAAFLNPSKSAAEEKDVMMMVKEILKKSL
eukprot:UN16053